MARSTKTPGRREAEARRKKLAADHTAGRQDAHALVVELERGALELWTELDKPRRRRRAGPR